MLDVSPLETRTRTAAGLSSVAAWLPPPAFWCRRGGDGRRVTWIELFFDLVFVAAVAQVGTPLLVDHSLRAVGRYAFLLTLIWSAWNGYAVYATRFDADDGLQRGLTLAQMVAVIFMAANAEDDLGSVSSAGFAAAYAVMRLILVAQYVRALAIPEARRLAGEYAIGFTIAAALWLVSSVTSAPARFVVWFAAISVDAGTSLMASRHTERLPPDASHLPERFGLFTLILLGESIVAVMKGVQAQPDWTPAAAASALLGMGFVFALWWWYFDGAGGAAERAVRSRADVRRLEVWTYAHLPLYIGLALASVSVERAVRDGAGVPLPADAAWVLCGAASAAMVALVVLNRTSRWPSGRRSVAQAILALVALLPAAVHDRLPAAHLIAVIAIVAVIETVWSVRTAALASVSAGRS